MIISGKNFLLDQSITTIKITNDIVFNIDFANSSDSKIKGILKFTKEFKPTSINIIIKNIDNNICSHILTINSSLRPKFNQKDKIDYLIGRIETISLNIDNAYLVGDIVLVYNNMELNTKIADCRNIIVENSNTIVCDFYVVEKNYFTSNTFLAIKTNNIPALEMFKQPDAIPLTEIFNYKIPTIAYFGIIDIFKKDNSKLEIPIPESEISKFSTPDKYKISFTSGNSPNIENEYFTFDIGNKKLISVNSIDFSIEEGGVCFIKDEIGNKKLQGIIQIKKIPKIDEIFINDISVNKLHIDYLNQSVKFSLTILGDNLPYDELSKLQFSNSNGLNFKIINNWISYKYERKISAIFEVSGLNNNLPKTVPFSLNISSNSTANFYPIFDIFFDYKNSPIYTSDFIKIKYLDDNQQEKEEDLGNNDIPNIKNPKSIEVIINPQNITSFGQQYIKGELTIKNEYGEITQKIPIDNNGVSPFNFKLSDYYKDTISNWCKFDLNLYHNKDKYNNYSAPPSNWGNYHIEKKGKKFIWDPKIALLVPTFTLSDTSGIPTLNTGIDFMWTYRPNFYTYNFRFGFGVYFPTTDAFVLEDMHRYFSILLKVGFENLLIDKRNNSTMPFYFGLGGAYNRVTEKLEPVFLLQLDLDWMNKRILNE